MTSTSIDVVVHQKHAFFLKFECCLFLISLLEDWTLPLRFYNMKLFRNIVGKSCLFMVCPLHKTRFIT